MSDSTTRKSSSGIGVALSGGGYRAAAFGLGVLLYLADSGKHEEVTCISSVSGGSVLNGYVASKKGFNTKDAHDIWSEAEPLAKTIAEKTLWLTPLTLLYLFVLAASLLAIVYASFFAWEGPGWEHWLVFSGPLLAWGALAQQRGVVADWAFRKRLFTHEGKTVRLADIEKNLDHVICATHLNAGEHFYFSGRFIYSYRFGWGTPGRLPLSTAVQASAAFPGGFPPRWLRTRPFRFDNSGEGRPGPLPKLVTLTDGGVYDNMADEWLSRLDERTEQAPDKGLETPAECLIVNSSAGLAWSYVKRLRIPVLGEALALSRDVDVMYGNSTRLRMRALHHAFEAHDDYAGVLVTISQSPLDVPGAFRHGSDEKATRAQAVYEILEPNAEEWAKVAEEDPLVPTTLSPLGPDVTARLMRHGYANAMANSCVILDYPMRDPPPLERFLELTR